jgi:arsenate reductase (thioredoxin)
MDNKQNVLFLCTGNSARSQMAEAFLRRHGGEYFEAFSAGLEPREINPYTILVMEEVGFDLTSYRSKGVEVFLGKRLFQYLITVCDEAEKNCPTMWPGVNQRFHWSFEDPAALEGTEEEIIQKFREIRDEIDQKVRAWVAEKIKAVHEV